MKVLITSYMTPQASHRYSFFHKVIGDFSYFVASDVCENFPYDFSVAALKNKCIKAARIIKPDWLIILSGIDCSIKSLPSFNRLDENVLYIGYQIVFNKIKRPASNWILSRRIYENYLLDESFHCYGWEDYDFVYNVCKDIKSEYLDNFVTIDFDADPDHVKLVNSNEYALKTCKENEKKFMKKYFDLYGRNFVF